MRTFYDAVTASNIPESAEGVCGYDDGMGRWSAADWARFPNAVQVHISSLGTNTGHVLDCEPGNPNAVASVGWILQRRAAGVDPYVYTAEWAPGYTWADVRAACDARGVPYPHWWKAPGQSSEVGTWDGTQPLLVQYAYPGPYDVNSVADFLPGIEAEPPPGPPLEDVYEAVKQRMTVIGTQQHTCFLSPTSNGEATLWHRVYDSLGPTQYPAEQLSALVVPGAIVNLDDNAGLDVEIDEHRNELHIVCRYANTNPNTVAHFWCGLPWKPGTAWGGGAI